MNTQGVSASEAAARARRRVAMLRVTELANMGLPLQALKMLEALSLASPGQADSVVQELRCLIMLRRLAEARALYDESTALIDNPSAMTALLPFTAQLYEGAARTERLRALLSKATLQGPNFMAVKLKLLLALREYTQYLRDYDRFADIATLSDDAADLQSVAASLRNPAYPDFARPKVFGIGLSRTATTSVAAALRTLGWSTLHWANHLTGEIIGDDDLYLFDAFFDTPVATNFERDYYLFPRAKFIYTTRPFVDWRRSWIAHTKRVWTLGDHQQIAALMRQGGHFRFGRRFAEIHMTLYYNYPDYHTAYHEHRRRVRRFFADKPADRFVEFDVFAGDSWEKLAAFVGRPVPDTAFPWTNQAPQLPAASLAKRQ